MTPRKPPENGPASQRPDEQRRKLWASLRTSFLTGLVVIAPIGLTLWLIWTVVTSIDGWVLPFVPTVLRPTSRLGIDIPGVGVVLFLVFAVLVGWVAKGVIGSTFLRWGEALVDRTPVIRSVYNGVKQVAETAFSQSETSFDRACLVQYPRPGLWAIGFISTRAKGEIAARLEGAGRIETVFIPTTPNPTSGFLLFIPASELIPLDMGVEDAAKLVISAGLVYPNPRDPLSPSVAARDLPR
ncbi:DUF502 domain-containing protein [Rhodobaculum claviforme]|uniref:DUF502 domain-containing protein n=1 Tax=Rhodobaculum claviforme TaxID=1549854 RepID=A0A934TJ45_9RHOB|nr:DUF502 domain-containing protein [Rhodobaculum claviforme]MBK5925968.1 hypothetical protein [Rhodobaculum claviforme]